MDYYTNVEWLMGGREKTQEFFRVFLVPGMNHGTGGDGAFAIDYLSYLEKWIEHGQAPDVIIGSHLQDWSFSVANLTQIFTGPPASASVVFTRPIYPYPLWAKYTGAGNPNDAANFQPIGSRKQMN